MECDLYRLSRRHVLVVGDIMLDRYVWGEVSRISPEAPVPVVHVLDSTEVLGGAGNVAANLAGLGCRVSIMGTCGLDPAGSRVSDLLQRQHIRSLLTTDARRPTITKTRVMAQRQQLLRLDEENNSPPGAAFRCQQMEIMAAALNDVAVVILSDYGKGFLQTADLAQDMLRYCHERGIPVLVDPKGRDWARYHGADCVTPNTAEVALAAGAETVTEEQVLRAASHLRRTFQLNRVLVTRGARGMCLLEDDRPPYTIAARAREVFDVSGAGDTVVATLGAGLALGLSWRQAAELANTAAGIVVGKLGTQPIQVHELQAALDSRSKPQTSIEVRKIVDWEGGRHLRTDWRSAGLQVVFTNGCFDILHPGHIHLLRHAAQQGDRLIVGLNSDISVKRLKGDRRPVLSAADRSVMLAALGCVDAVVVFDDDTPLQLITYLQPDILVKGADYRIEEVVGAEVVGAYGGKVRLLPLLEGFSTTALVSRLEKENSSKT